MVIIEVGRCSKHVSYPDSPYHPISSAPERGNTSPKVRKLRREKSKPKRQKSTIGKYLFVATRQGGFEMCFVTKPILTTALFITKLVLNCETQGFVITSSISRAVSDTLTYVLNKSQAFTQKLFKLSLKIG